MKYKKKRLRLLDYSLLIIFIIVVYFFYYKIDSVLIYKWDWLTALEYFFIWNEETEAYQVNILITGFFITFKLVLWSGLFSLLLGGILGLLSSSRHLSIRLIISTYVSFVRNMPLLVFLFIFYFFISSQLLSFLDFESILREKLQDAYWIEFFFIEASLLENFVAGVLSLTLYETAYISEIVRGGVNSVAPGQKRSSTKSRAKKMACICFCHLSTSIKKCSSFTDWSAYYFD